MKKQLSCILVPLLSLVLVGCEKSYETPKLKTFEVDNPSCENLVIFIGDGMGPEHVKAGQLVYNKTYDFTSWNQTVSDTCSYDAFIDDYAVITDSAAGGTAIAIGEVTNNYYVGKNKDGVDCATILDYAKSMGKSVGVVSTDEITGATPADFSAHAMDRSMTQVIIDTQIQSNVDLFIGHYSKTVDERKEDIKNGGYTYYSSYSEIEGINKKDKVWCQFNFEEYSGDVTLKQAVEVAVSYLSQNKKGYVLMVEQAHVDKFSHSNDFENAMKAVNSLNDTVEYVKQTSDKTGIIISADHETGNLNVSLEDIYPNNYNGVSYIYYSGSHTSKNVPVYTYGFDVDFKEFSIYNTNEKIKNKDIFRIALYAISGYKLEGEKYEPMGY